MFPYRNLPALARARPKPPRTLIKYRSYVVQNRNLGVRSLMERTFSDTELIQIHQNVKFWKVGAKYETALKRNSATVLHMEIDTGLSFKGPKT